MLKLNVYYKIKLKKNLNACVSVFNDYRLVEPIRMSQTSGNGVFEIQTEDRIFRLIFLSIYEVVCRRSLITFQDSSTLINSLNKCNPRLLVRF